MMVKIYFRSWKKTKLQDEITSKGRKTSSRVHKYFKKINNNKDAICLIENCEITVQSVCSTNLKNHLKSYHKEIFDEVTKEDELENEKKKNEKINSNQQTIEKFFKDEKKYKSNEKRQLEGEKLFAYFLASTKYPYD